MSTANYWRGIRPHYRLLGSRCKHCGSRFFPPRSICRKCLSTEIESLQLPDRGKLLTFTIIRNPPQGFEEFAPYIIGIVELDDGVRVLSQIDALEEELTEGLRLEAVLRRYSLDGEEGIIRYGLKFRIPVQDLPRAVS
jgi:uncharacterized OB-fold protein